MTPIKDRAYTSREKTEIIHRILRVWTHCPGLRLGQLLDNAVYKAPTDLFMVEDDRLAQLCEEFQTYERTHRGAGI